MFKEKNTMDFITAKDNMISAMKSEQTSLNVLEMWQM
jgi:hypothetical protein